MGRSDFQDFDGNPSKKPYSNTERDEPFSFGQYDHGIRHN